MPKKLKTDQKLEGAIWKSGPKWLVRYYFKNAQTGRWEWVSEIEPFDSEVKDVAWLKREAAKYDIGNTDFNICRANYQG